MFARDDVTKNSISLIGISCVGTQLEAAKLVSGISCVGDPGHSRRSSDTSCTNSSEDSGCSQALAKGAVSTSGCLSRDSLLSGLGHFESPSSAEGLAARLTPRDDDAVLHEKWKEKLK